MRRFVLPAVLLAAFVASTAQTIVIAVLPAIARENHVPASAVTWALTAFMLAAAVANPVAGRLGDLFGYRRVLLTCLGVFAAGTVVCAVSRSFPLLLAGRAVSGVSAGVFPVAFGLVRQTVEQPRRPQTIAALSAMFGLGGSAGMVVAGPVRDAWGTAWLFWPLLALALVAVVLGALTPRDAATGGGRMDVTGAVLLAGALACLLLAISESRVWPLAVVVPLAAAALALFAAFTVAELRIAQPLVAVRLLRRRTVATVNGVTAVIAAAMFGAVTMLPRLVQDPAVFGKSATAAGLVLVPMAVVMLVATPLAPRLGGRTAVRLGAGLAVAALALLACVHDALWSVYVANVLVGAGYGLCFAALGNLVVDAVEPRHTGMATGVNTIARTAGGAVGAQLAAALAYPTGFVLFALVAALAVVAARAVAPRYSADR
ncbi:MFS transporter [Amycolatopsis thermalba]|uniref:MFS transporter n=1 Tax=Amycolatopsis thermalba TaxID=944492 RepID=UPI0013BE932F|nr:MFS transporter [Amycolatopsis thermalba]